MVFEIDFEKAFDHVDWYFLNFVLKEKGLKVDGECGSMVA